MELIDKQATIDWLKKVTVTEGITFEAGFEQIIYDIEQMPRVEPRAAGRWTPYQMGEWIYQKCSRCDKIQDAKSNYCPNCGAKMEVEDESDHN